MTEQIQIIPDKLHITSIRILGGNISAGPNPDVEKIINYNIQYSISDDLSLESKLFRFVFFAKIEALGQDDKNLGISGDYTIEFIFYVDNLEYYVVSADHEKKNVVFHNVLPHTLLSIVYSTSRGIILSRTQGTIIDGVVLPVIDTRMLIKSMEENKKMSEKGEVLKTK